MSSFARIPSWSAISIFWTFGVGSRFVVVLPELITYDADGGNSIIRLRELMLKSVKI